MRIAQRRNLSLTTTNRRSATARKAKISVSRRGRALSAAVVAVRHPRRRCCRCAAFHHFPVWWTPLTATANPHMLLSTKERGSNSFQHPSPNLHIIITFSH